MNIKKNLSILLLTSLVGAGLTAFPVCVFAGGKVLTGGITMIEKDVTYLTPLGLLEGAQKDDTAQIFRGEEKIAEVRLISVLSGSSVAEVVKLYNSSGIQETDSIRLFHDPSAAAAPVEKPMLSSGPKNEELAELFGDNSKSSASSQKQADKTAAVDNTAALEQLKADHQAELLQKEKQVQQKMQYMASDVDSLQKKVMEKDSAVESLRIEIEKLKKIVAEREERLNDQKTLNENLSRMLDAAKQQIEAQRVESETKIVNLREENTQQIMKQENSTRERLLAQENQSSDKIAELQRQVDELTKDKLSLADQVNGKESISKALMEERARLRTEVDGLNTRITQLIQEHTNDFLKQDQDAQKKLAAQAQTMQDKITALETELASVKENYKAETDAAKAEADNNKETIAALQKEKDAMRVDVLARDQKIADFGIEKEFLTNELNKTQEQAKYLAGELDSLKASTESKVTAFTSDIQQKNTMIQTLSSDKQGIMTELQDRDRKIIGLNAVNEQTRGELKQARDTVAATRADLDQKNALLDKLTKEKDMLTVTINERDQKIADQDAQMTGLRGELKTAQEAAAVLLGQYTAMKSALQEKGDELDSANKEKENLFAAIKERDQRLADLTKASDAASQEIAKLRTDADNKKVIIDTLSDGLKEGVKKLDIAKIEAEKLSADLKKSQDKESFQQEQLKAFKSSTQQEIAALKKELDQKVSQIAGLNKEKEASAKSLQDKDQKLSDTSAEVRKLQDELSSVRDGADRDKTILSEALKDKETQIQGLAADKASLFREIQDKEQQLKELTSSADKTKTDLTTALDQTRIDLKKSEDDNQALQNEFNVFKAGAQAQIAALQGDVEKKKSDIEALNQQKETLSGELKDRIQRLEKANVDIAGLQADLKRSQDRVTISEGELSALKVKSQNDSEALRNQIDLKESSLAGLIKEKQALTDQLKDKDQKLMESMLQAQKLQADLKSAQDQTGALAGELDVLKIKTQNESAALKSQIDQKESSLQALTSEKQALIDQLKDKEQKFADLTAQTQKMQDDWKKTQDQSAALFFSQLRDSNQKVADINAAMEQARANARISEEKIAALQNELKAAKSGPPEETVALKGEISRKDDALKALNQDKGALDAELTKVRAQMDDLQAELAKIKTEAPQKENQLIQVQVSLQKDIKDKESQISLLTSENSLLRESRKEADSLRAELMKLRDEVPQKEKQFVREQEALQKDLKDKDAQISSLILENSSLKGIQKEADGLRAELMKIRDEAPQKEKQFIHEQEALQKDLKDKDAQISSLTLENSSLRGIRKEADGLRAELERVRDEVPQKEKQFMRDQEALQRDLKEKEAKISVLTQENVSLRDARAKVDALEMELERVKNEGPQKEKQFMRDQEALQRELKDREAKISVLTQENVSLREARFKVDALQAELDRVKNEAPQKERQYLQAQEDLQRDLRDKDAKISALMQENSSLRNSRTQIDALQAELDRVKNEAPKKDKQSTQAQEALKREVAEKESRINSLMEENSWLKQNVDKLNQLLIHLNKNTTPRAESEAPRKTSSLKTQPARTSDPSPAAVNFENWEDYYAGIRKMILAQLGEVDLSPYVGKSGQIEIEFEIQSNGFLKDEPKFYGVNDPELQRLLKQCFHKASPFPKFPVNLTEESKIFTIVVEF